MSILFDGDLQLVARLINLRSKGIFPFLELKYLFIKLALLLIFVGLLATQLKFIRISSARADARFISFRNPSTNVSFVNLISGTILPNRRPGLKTCQKPERQVFGDPH
eukprot:TRINITY_DN12109_c0_g1_i1.p2 TRINITY_DN12109_c0_g1~~TRINITY_DN12109_c0_g1_i1.p2  ORF type:complete len:108 (+),score=7.33 TRINITY_DN12109_c0_g1_i1:515-838(+)